MKIVGVIPARYQSSRFVGKPLAQIAGKPLLQHVVERSRQAEQLERVVVATDDARIAEAAQAWCEVEMTGQSHPSGTDRVAEVIGRYDCDGAVNIQGDEPLLDPKVIDRVAGGLVDTTMTTAATPISSVEDYRSPNVVKVVVNRHGRALYFSRRTIPYLRDIEGRPEAEQMSAFPFLKHLGIYGFRRDTLLWFVEQPVSPLEHAEKLEQLRALDAGVEVAVLQVDYAGWGVDVPEDIPRVEEMLQE